MSFTNSRVLGLQYKNPPFRYHRFISDLQMARWYIRHLCVLIKLAFHIIISGVLIVSRASSRMLSWYAYSSDLFMRRTWNYANENCEVLMNNSFTEKLQRINCLCLLDLATSNRQCIHALTKRVKLNDTHAYTHTHAGARARMSCAPV